MNWKAPGFVTVSALFLFNATQGAARAQSAYSSIEAGTELTPNFCIEAGTELTPNFGTELTPNF